MLKVWLEAMRLRTLPVSISGVVIAVALAACTGDKMRWTAAVLCLVFALLAQISSNFANEYYDFKAGIDKKGREGFRRGVTEGDIKPHTLKIATFGTLAAACLVGLALVPYADWWLIAVGLAIAIGVLAYSTGPYPLSHHGLGEVAVFVFYGLIPVNFTFYLTTGAWSGPAMLAAIATGFMGTNVLLVNNIRDHKDDREAGKRTSVVIFGRKLAILAYMLNGIAAMAFLTPIWTYLVLRCFVIVNYTGHSGRWWLFIVALMPLVIYLMLHVIATRRLKTGEGKQLNPVLAATARNMLVFTVLFAVALFVICLP